MHRLAILPCLTEIQYNFPRLYGSEFQVKPIAKICTSNTMKQMGMKWVDSKYWNSTSMLSITPK